MAENLFLAMYTVGVGGGVQDLEELTLEGPELNQPYKLDLDKITKFVEKQERFRALHV